MFIDQEKNKAMHSWRSAGASILQRGYEHGTPAGVRSIDYSFLLRSLRVGPYPRLPRCVLFYVPYSSLPGNT